MNRNIKLRKEYHQLVIEGKKEEAWKKLQEIWALDKGELPKELKKDKEKKEEIKPIEEKEELKIPSKFKTIKDLSKIHGVGRVTVNELAEKYDSLEELINVMKKGKNLVTLDYIEEKIKKELNI
jgi:nucleotidyltransferase/DNA polymerase involved in DNA repair